MWFSGIIAITNSNGDSATPWKIPLWIFTSAQRFPPAVSSTSDFGIKQAGKDLPAVKLGTASLISEGFFFVVVSWRVANEG